MSDENILTLAVDDDAAADAQRQADAQAVPAEEADCKAWLKRIKEARSFDKGQRKQYAKDRSYCRGDANRDVYDVYVNIAGSYVDVLTGFLYAKDPDVDVLPADSCGPSRLEDARQLGKTLEIVIANLWKKGKLKLAADAFVRSGLTVGIGWIKSAWLNRTGSDPVIESQIADLQDNIKRLDAIKQQIDGGEAPNPDELRAQYEQQLQGLEAQVEVVISRGLFIDFVRAEDIQVSTEVASLKTYVNAPWIAHRSFVGIERAKEQYPDVADRLCNAKQYFQAKARDKRGVLESIDADDAESFRAGTVGAVDETAEAHICIWEVWERESNNVLTFAEGLDRYLVPPLPPAEATSRFYPFFSWAPLWVDGERHPHSLISRSSSLLDEYNRIRTNYREHRRRAIPKMGFDSSAVEPDEARKMEGAASGEMVGLNLNGQSSKEVLFPLQYNSIDAALYDTSAIRSELEMIWGIQEALSSSIRTAKTLGEAEIQQQGTESRLGYMRDSMEDMLGELAQYTAEVSLQELAPDDVAVIAGPEAFWPASMGVDDLESLVSVEIRAGSSGKPNTSSRMQQWSQLLPQLVQGIQMIGQFRQSSPLDMANSFEQLVIETFNRTGEHIDPNRFIPPAPMAQPAPLAPVVPINGQPQGVPGQPPEMPPQLPPEADPGMQQPQFPPAA